jgi:hypothetical protein
MSLHPVRGTWQLLLAAVAATGPIRALAQPTPPKVPFSNQACASISEADLTSLHIPSPVASKPDRAPATLQVDNVCSYTHGGTLEAQVGYQTKGDYDANSQGNRSTKRKTPSDLPGAFYDKQGGLWFTKNGYYVVVSGRSALREPVARIIVKRL